jgi:hypothetical protein
MVVTLLLTMQASIPNVNAATTAPQYAQKGWAGYVWVDTSNAVTASLQLPQVHPARNTSAAFWTGFGVRPGIEQTGFTANVVNGDVSWSSWYQLWPAPAVAFGKVSRSGDYVTMTVTYRGNSLYTLTLKNSTEHWAVSVTKGTKESTLGIAEATTEAYGPPPAQFTGARFYNLPTNGNEASAYTLPWAKLSKLSGHTFSVSWQPS